MGRKRRRHASWIDSSVLRPRSRSPQRSETRRGQCGDDRDRVDRALVEHSEDDIDRDQRGEDQDRRAAQ
jgi:hypothetical protein